MIQQALYRVWRSQNFDELVGQDHIRRTLENAILQDRVSHAYLFTGPRGTGKTSTARILAKALNCAARQGASPCGVCESCRGIADGNAMDVLEIDGASNRGIEEIRDLKEKIGFLPSLGKYKIYIVDEAHMLTTEAFNALLKTLEEPPEHVIFILATTEPQRMPATILSRCQRFDFRKLSHAVIKTRLEEILAAMEREAQPDALSLIIRQADGSMRDAISLLDQCLSYSLSTLTMDDACEILGLVRRESLASLLEAVTEGDAPALFAELDRLFNQGVEPMQLLKEFAGYCRDLLLMALCGADTAMVEAVGEQRRHMAAQAGRLGPSRLRRIVSQADQIAAGGRYRGNSRYMAEALFAEALLESAGGQGTATANPQAQTSASTNTSTSASASAKASARAKPSADPPGAAATPAPVPMPAPTDAAGHAADSRLAFADAALPHATGDRQAPPDAGPPASGGTPEPRNAQTQPLADGALPAALWEQVLQAVRSQKIVLHAFIVASLKQELRGGTLTLYFDPVKGSFHKERSEDPANLPLIREAASQVFGAPVEVVCALQGGGQDKDPIDKAIEIFGRDVVKLV